MTRRRSKALRKTGVLLGLAAAAAVPESASAYELNPLYYGTRVGEMPPQWARKIDTVHEDMTHAAVGCANSVTALSAA